MSLLPGYEWFAREIRGDRKSSANHLAALDGKIDILTGLITQYDIEVMPLEPHFGAAAALRMSSIDLYGVSERMYRR